MKALVRILGAWAMAAAVASPADLADVWATAVPRTRAEMRDFYWEVLAAPYPTEAGARVQRELAQLNAYRRMAGCGPLSDQPELRTRAQAAAAMLAANGRISHTIDPSWVGYTDEIAATLLETNLAQYVATPYAGAAELLVFDAGEANAGLVGHRSFLLNPRSTEAGLGFANNVASAPPDFAVITALPQTNNSGTSSADAFVAWPPPGYFPRALLRSPNNDQNERLRWSFRPNVTTLESDFAQAIVTATISNRTIAVMDQRYTRAWPITWEFADADLLGDDVAVTIEISNAIVRGVPFSCRYTVTLFDENVSRLEELTTTSPIRNLAARGYMSAGDDALIIGFAVTGSQPLRVAVRSQGPSLRRLGVGDATDATTFRVYDATGTVVAATSGWLETRHWRLLQDGGLAPPSPLEAAAVLLLNPGTYTTVLSGGRPGTALLELFAIDSMSTSFLSNLSVRGRVDAPLIAGFSAQRDTRIAVMLYGSRLRQFGVSSAAADLGLVCFAGENTITTLDLAPTDVRALSLALVPGAYTAVVTGPAGIALLEVNVVSSDI